MKTEKVTTYIKSFSIGRRGENIARQIAFDLSDFVAEYGEGTPELIFQRPIDDKPYPVAAVRDGSALLWTVTDLDTAVATANGGYSRCELRWYIGELLAKSQTWLVYVDTAMNVPSETVPPDPEQGWVDQIIAVGAAAKASADAAKADADRAATLAVDVSEKAAQTAQNASDTANAKEAAETAKRLAEEAQLAAETAQKAAEAAQAAAEQSATDADGAKRAAEAALKATQDAAAVAAKALADIRALYQEMQTWAQGVIQDVNAAGSVAVQSVQTAGDAQVQRVTNEGATQTANAKAQADAAAQSASGAAQSAQEAAESAAVYDDVVADVNQLKQDVADITPDDTVVDGKPWTSKKIVDTICQPIEESGNPVQVYPIEGYPLGVKVSWEPTQEGEGDPSPDNIRPITGRDAVSVTRCGRNLLDYSQLQDYTSKGVTYTKQPDGGIRVAGTASAESNSIVIDYTNTALPAGKYVPRLIGRKNTSLQVVLKRANGSKFWTSISFSVADGDILLYTYIRVAGGVSCDEIVYPMLVKGDIAPTAYEPYTGSTTDIAMPETVYGGTLDVETGVVTVSKRITIADGTVNKFTPGTSGEFWNMNGHSAPGIADVNNVENSHFVRKKFSGNKNHSFIYTTPIFMEGLFNTTDDLNAYLVEQNTAGTPVTFVYELQNPYTIQLTPQQITALSGVNTIYTDADGVIVTGAEDPKHTITELKNAIISLGGNI